MRIEHNRFADLESAQQVQARFDRAAVINGTPPAKRSVPMNQLSIAKDKSCWPWPGLIFVLLGINVTIVCTTMYLANSDPSFAIEPNYYHKAMEWNQTAEQRERNIALGWRFDVPITHTGEPLNIRIRDAHGSPISDATVELVAFHHARAGNRLVTSLHEVDVGRYQSVESLTRAGLWELRVRAQLEGEVCTTVVSHIVVESGGPR